jgi:crotonobetainyl-CoA:carnitine CoA-transferase CaiB-like acyl-CoA transferase
MNFTAVKTSRDFLCVSAIRSHLTDMSGQKRILEGIRVIEVASHVLGPSAAVVMSDFGADVVKVEPPRGDEYRRMPSNPPLPVCEMNYCWLLDNRNKRSVVLDLAEPAGLRSLRKLVRRADVFITNYLPAVLEKLRITYDDLAPINPRLVYAHGTGYGERGTERDKPGFDLTAYWGRSGLMENVRYADADPAMSLLGMGDHPSGMSLFGAIMLALYGRERTGRGSKVSTSLAANGVWSNSGLLQAELCGARHYPFFTRTTAFNPLINHYVTRDGKRILFCLLSPDRDFVRLSRALGRPELPEQPQFADAAARTKNSAELVAILDRLIGARDLSEWSEVFTRHEVNWSLVQTLKDVVNDEQMIENEIFVEFDHPRHGRLRTVNSPIFVEGVKKVPPRPAPELGADTAEVLNSLEGEE